MTSYSLARKPRNTAAAWSAIAIFGAFYIGKEISEGGSTVRIIVAIGVMIALGIPALERPKLALQVLFVMLPILGMVRHMFLSATGAASLDPLLLITSAVAITIFVSLILSGEMAWGRTTLSKLMFLFLIVGLLQVFNPGQRSFLVGLTGIMINLVPLLFFYIGRTLGDADFTRRVTRILIVLGSIAAVYGLKQLFLGFEGFQRTWLKSQGYGAATVGETTRPFSFFNNASEFAAYSQLAFIAVLAWLLFAPRTKRTILLGLTVLIGYSGFLIGSRGFTIKIGVALVVLMAARARNRMMATGVIILLVGTAVYWSATTTSTARIQDRQAGASQLIEQQLRALRDPFNREVSTLPIHFDQASESIRYSITKQPMGLGTGAPTRGGSKFGGLQASAELDIGDAFLAYGVPGGALYIVIILVSITVASRVRRALPGPVWIGIWAMLLSSIGAWMIGGNYSIAPLLWFFVGSADAAYERLRDRGLLRGSLTA